MDADPLYSARERQLTFTNFRPLDIFNRSEIASQYILSFQWQLRGTQHIFLSRYVSQNRIWFEPWGPILDGDRVSRYVSQSPTEMKK
jgi:hypothetical protein